MLNVICKDINGNIVTDKQLIKNDLSNERIYKCITDIMQEVFSTTDKNVENK